ncbi:hypothetical protein [Brevundimonas sp. M20]|uniref:arsenate reductase/protein-tyrosine-phosphatase family protein n=1 Tax=Brevundimonas sp. M20 TaxID=2591463 RepID=UPI00351A3967
MLFACLGNLCRSPLTEVALRAKATRLRLELIVEFTGNGNCMRASCRISGPSR